MADNFPHKHIIGYVHITPDLTTDNKISTTDHSSYTLSSLFGVFAKNGRQAIDVCAETGTTYINGVDPVAAYAYSYNAIPQLENLINGKLNNYIKDHDVFHYGGVLIPSNTKGQIGTFSYLVSDSMIIIGTSVKVQNDGWFGNYKVHAGDLLIAYDDAATTSSTNYWDILETHLGPLNSKGTYTNANSPKFLTNIYLNDNGDLSYSYSYFTQVNSYVNGGEKTDIDDYDFTVISNVNFDPSGKFTYQLHNLTNSKLHHSSADDKYRAEKQVITNLNLSSGGHLTYASKVLGNEGVHGTDKNLLGKSGEFKVINNIWQDGDGNISYTYSTITYNGEHHKSTGIKDTDVTFGGNDNEIRVITNTYVDSHGSLSYTYVDLKYNEQHHTQGASSKQSEITFGKDENDENYVYVLTGVNLSTDGTLTYSYRPISWEEDHHDNTGKQQDSITFEKNDESVKVITNVNLGSKGELSYTYLTLSFNDEHHGTTTNNARGFIDEVYLSSEGTLSYHKTEFSINAATSATSIENIRNTSSGELDVLTGISIDSDTGKISYQYKTINYNTSEDHHTTTINNGNGFVSDVYLDEGGNLTYSKQKFEISNKDGGDTDLSTSSLNVITGVSINEDTGKIAYEYNTINTTHSSNGVSSTSNSPKFINNVRLNDSGVLSYTWSEFKTEKSSKTETGQTLTYVHIDGTGKLTYVANVLSADSSSYGTYNLDGNSYINVVTGITQRGDGKLSYSTTTLKHHHGTTTNGANGFVSDVYLSDNGQLTYAKTAFSAPAPTAAGKTYNITNTSKGYAYVINALSINADTGAITYTYNVIAYDLTEAHHSSTGTKSLNGENFLTNVKISETGEISYTYYPFSSTKSTNTASLENSGSLDVISSVNLSKGNLSYTVTSVSNINKHHTNKTGVAQTTVTLGDQNNEVVNVVSGLKISNTGELSYTYTPVKISYNHHRIGTATELDLETFGGDENHDNEIKPITGISVTADGAISYTYAPTKWNEKHHTTTTNSSNGFVSDVYLDAYGNLSYAKTAFSAPAPTASGNTYNITNTSSGFVYVINAININADTGAITYTYNAISYNLTQSHHTTNTGVKDSEKNLTTEQSVKVISGVNLSTTGELSYSYYEIPQIKQTDNQVQKSLFMGDNNTTYMLSIDNGKIVIVQPIKSTSVSQGVTTSDTYSDGGSWLGASYDFSNYGLTVGTQQLIIQMGGTITTESIKDINGSSSNYSVSTNGDTFTITLSGTNKQTITTTPAKLTGNFTNIGNIVFKDSISAKDYNVRIEIDANNILSKTLSLPAKTKQQTVSVKANIYRCIGNPTSSNVSASAVSSKPTSVTFSSGGDIKYIFPEVFGTPTFKQLNAPDTNWELKSTVQYSTSSFSGTTNKVNYKVYGVKNATTSGGTWQISW